MMAHLLSVEYMCIFSSVRQVYWRKKERQSEFSLEEMKCKATPEGYLSNIS